jgi:glycosyltransferase involved in cell wall biosynthesis
VTVKLVVASAWATRFGGAENHLWTLLRHLDRSRLEPTVVFLAEGPFVDEVESLGLRTVVLPTTRVRQGGRFVRTWRALHSLFREERPDAILGWGPKPQLYLGPAAAAAGMSRRNAWLSTEIPGHPVHRLAIWLPAGAILCPSRYVQERVRPLARGRPVLVVHSGIELRPRPEDAALASLRAGLGLPDGTPVAGMVARLAPVKGQHHFLRALAELRRRGTPVHGLLVGGAVHGLDPGYEPELHRLCAELGLDGSVTFTGHVADPLPHTALLDVFVSAATEDGFPMAPIEAMGLGIPVVAVDAGGPRELVEDGVSGLLVPGTDPGPLADAIGAVALDPGRRARLGEAARRRVDEGFTAQRMAADYADRLEELARDGA